MKHVRTVQKTWVSLLVGLGLLGVVVGAGHLARAQEPGTSTTSKRDTTALKKLDQILTNQQKILQRLDDVMEELRIIKVRATR